MCHPAGVPRSHESFPQRFRTGLRCGVLSVASGSTELVPYRLALFVFPLFYQQGQRLAVGKDEEGFFAPRRAPPISSRFSLQ
jgi:hypothetical protein